MTPQLRYVSVGRNYFSHDHKDCVVDLGGGKVLWVGTFKSVRMGWLPMLNVDMANKPAYEKVGDGHTPTSIIFRGVNCFPVRLPNVNVIWGSTVNYRMS